MATNKQRGKRTEQAIAKRLGGRRVGTMGGEDVFTSDFSIECKSRAAFAGEKFMQQAERNAPKGMTPLVVVHIHGRGHSNDLVMMRLKDWELWMGEIKRYPK